VLEDNNYNLRRVNDVNRYDVVWLEK